MFPASRDSITVTVEYTARGTRTSKTFPTMTAARRFYIAKTAAGAEPRVLRGGDRLPELKTPITESTQMNSTIPAKAFSAMTPLEQAVEMRRVRGLSNTQLRDELVARGDKAELAKQLAEPDGQAPVAKVSVVRAMGMKVDPREVAKVFETERVMKVEQANAKMAAKADKAKPAAAKAEKPAKTEKAPAEEKAAPKGRKIGAVEKPVAERRQMLVKLMVKMGAVSPATAKTKGELAAKCGLTEFDVYGLLYHTHLLQTGGFVKQVKIDGVKGLCYHLTAKGLKATAEQLASTAK